MFRITVCYQPLNTFQAIFIIMNKTTLYFILSVDGVIYNTFVLANIDKGC